MSRRALVTKVTSHEAGTENLRDMSATSSSRPATPVTLWAVADLHGAVADNRSQIESLQPRHPADWLIVAGDVAERTDVVLDILEKLAGRFARVIWAPGNHELFCRMNDLHKGRAKYDALVRGCRDIGVLTPDDPYAVFAGRTIVPLFTLYDYSFRFQGMTVDQAVQAAHDRQVVMTDQFAIAPFVDIRAWCWDRLAYSVKRLSRVQGPTILINHWPLVIEPVERLAFPELSLWCGTRHTRSWAQRYHAEKVIYGHLHTPGVTVVDGIPHIEVSLGYPREWRMERPQWVWPYPVLEVPRA